MNTTPEHEDMDFEPEDEFGSVGAAKAKLQKLRDELEVVKKERQEYLDGWQRCKADAVNMRKDIEREAARSAERLREALVHDIIPALDSFDMATGSETWNQVNDGWRSGMEHVRNQLIEALRSHGIERYGSVGDAFDHVIHDAVDERDDVRGESNTVARVLRYGYKSRDKIIRPAQVIIKK